MTITKTHDDTITAIPTGSWGVDPSHSEVGFSVRHLGLSKVRGHFRTFSGSVDATEKLADATIDVTIDLSSVDTNDEQRDSHLLGPDFFDVENNPTMTFRSTSIAIATDGTRGTITGDLTIAGTTRSVDLNTEFNGVATDAYGTDRAGFSATTTLSRKEFGIDFDVPLDAGGVLIGDKVNIELEVQLVPAKD